MSRVLDRVRQETTALCADVPDLLKAKKSRLPEARRRVARLVNCVAIGRVDDSQALAAALADSEASVASLKFEVQSLEDASDSTVRFPSRRWGEPGRVRELLQRRREDSGLLLRRLGSDGARAGPPGSGRSLLRCSDQDRMSSCCSTRVLRIQTSVVRIRLWTQVQVHSDGGTRSETIRTVAALPLEEVLRDTVPAPLYQRLAGAAAALRAKGWSDHAIAVEFGVTDKTIGKAIRWL